MHPIVAEFLARYYPLTNPAPPPGTLAAELRRRLEVHAAGLRDSKQTVLDAEFLVSNAVYVNDDLATCILPENDDGTVLARWLLLEAARDAEDRWARQTALTAMLDKQDAERRAAFEKHQAEQNAAKEAEAARIAAKAAEDAKAVAEAELPWVPYRADWVKVEDFWRKLGPRLGVPSTVTRVYGMLVSGGGEWTQAALSDLLPLQQGNVSTALSKLVELRAVCRTKNTNVHFYKAVMPPPEFLRKLIPLYNEQFKNEQAQLGAWGAPAGVANLLDLLMLSV